MCNAAIRFTPGKRGDPKLKNDKREQIGGTVANLLSFIIFESSYPQGESRFNLCAEGAQGYQNTEAGNGERRQHWESAEYPAKSLATEVEAIQ